MHKVWVHEEFAVHRRPGALRARRQACPALNIPLLIGAATLVVLLTGVPLFIIRTRQLPSPAVVRAALPSLQFKGSGYTARSRYRVSALPPRPIGPPSPRFNVRSAQIGYLASLISRTGIQSANASQLASLIVNESIAANWDPFLAASIIFAESTFRNHARSSAGAVGLMQIQPATGRYVSRLYRVRWHGPAALHDPPYNIRLGLAYLHYLKNLFGGDLSRALVAYNWGPGNLAQHLYKRGRRPPTESIVYSQKIQRLSRAWRQQFAAQTSRMYLSQG